MVETSLILLDLTLSPIHPRMSIVVDIPVPFHLSRMIYLRHPCKHAGPTFSLVGQQDSSIHC